MIPSCDTKWPNPNILGFLTNNQLTDTFHNPKKEEKKVERNKIIICYGNIRIREKTLKKPKIKRKLREERYVYVSFQKKKRRWWRRTRRRKKTIQHVKLRGNEVNEAHFGKQVRKMFFLEVFSHP